MKEQNSNNCQKVWEKEGGEEGGAKAVGPKKTMRFSKKEELSIRGIFHPIEEKHYRQKRGPKHNPLISDAEKEKGHRKEKGV